MKARRHNRRGDQGESKRRRRGRSRRWLAIAPLVVVTTLTLLWLAPAIVAHTALKQKILSAALSDFEGSVTVESASLGWMSPILACNIDVFDLHGQPLAQVQSVRSEKSLLGLLTDRSRPGRIQIEEPTVHLVLRENGSNWQDALAGYLSAPAGETAVSELTVEVIEGKVEIRDDTTGHAWQVSQMNGALQFAPDGAAPVKLRAEGSLAAAGQPPGRVAIDLAWQPSQSAEGGLGEGQLTVHSRALPLGPIVSAGRRVVGDVYVEGTASCDVVCQWSENAGSHRIDIDNLIAENVSVFAPDRLGDDRLRTAHLNGSARLKGDGDRWRVEQLVLETDFASIDARGSVPMAEVASADFWTNLAGRLSDDDVHVRGHVDLAQLADMLPSTLNARPTGLSSGTADFSVDSLSEGYSGFTTRLELANLVTANGRDELNPILLSASVRRSAEGPVIDQIVCQSSFLTLTAQGTLSEGSAVIQGDLEQMAAEIGHVIDFGSCTLAGRLDGNLRWQRSVGNQVAATGKLDLRDFELTVSEEDRWVEKHLTVNLAGKAEVREGQVQQVTAGSLSIDSGNDRFVAALTSPVDRPTRGTTWPLHVKASGQLATWVPRLKPILSGGSWQLAGAIDLDAMASVSPAAIDVQSMQLRVADFRARAADFVIDEPTIQLEVQGLWDAEQGRVTARDATMTSSTVAFRAQQVVVQLAPAPLAVSGSLSYRGDVQRLYRYWQNADSPFQNQLTGTVTGVVRASHESGVTQVDWSGEAKELAYASKPTTQSSATIVNASHASAMHEVWREPVVKLAGRQRYDQKSDSLAIDELFIQAASLHLAIRGRIESLCGRPVADLAGEVDCDLADLSRKLSPILGPSIQLTGRDKSQFTLRGPLAGVPASISATGKASPGSPSPAITLTSIASGDDAGGSLVSPELAGNAKLAWQSANVHGLLVGRGDLVASLDGGIIHFAPLQVPVSEGRLLAQPRIDLRSQPATVYVDKGPLIENVRISPQMCQTWLKYVAPLLADATRAEGRFSIALDGARIPLLDQRQSDVHGQLTIHNAQIGPGPLAQQFISIAQQVKSVIDGRSLGSGGTGGSTWLVVPEQAVRFDVSDGRVQHHGLVVTAGDVQIRTSGSVGMDETLALVAEVPIQDSWVAGKAYLSALKGTTIKVPVRGTLSKPQVDGRVLRELSREMIGGAAGRLLEGELNRGLRQLFGS